MSRIFRTPFSSVYPLYIAKLERKGRTQAELDEVILWLTGFSDAELQQHLTDGTTFEDFFAAAHLNPAAGLITGVICGVRVEQIEDPLMQKIRYLDKMVDELYKGKALEKVLRVPVVSAGQRGSSRGQGRERRGRRRHGEGHSADLDTIARNHEVVLPGGCQGTTCLGATAMERSPSTYSRSAGDGVTAAIARSSTAANGSATSALVHTHWAATRQPKAAPTIAFSTTTPSSDSLVAAPERSLSTRTATVCATCSCCRYRPNTTGEEMIARCISNAESRPSEPSACSTRSRKDAASESQSGSPAGRDCSVALRDSLIRANLSIRMSSLVGKYRYTLRGDIPASAAMASMVVASYPCVRNRRSATAATSARMARRATVRARLASVLMSTVYI